MPSLIRTKEPEDIRRELSKLYREVKEGKVDPLTAKCLVYIGLSIVSITRESTLDLRITELEESLNIRRSA